MVNESVLGFVLFEIMYFYDKLDLIVQHNRLMVYYKVLYQEIDGIRKKEIIVKFLKVLICTNQISSTMLQYFAYFLAYNHFEFSKLKKKVIGFIELRMEKH